MEAAYVKVSRSNQALHVMLLYCVVKETVGEALKEGLAEVALVRPVDPIEYLSSWLLQYKENEENAEQVSNFIVQYTFWLVVSVFSGPMRFSCGTVIDDFGDHILGHNMT